MQMIMKNLVSANAHGIKHQGCYSAHQLKQQVNSFLCSSSCENENRLLPNDVLMLRNEGEGHGVLMEHQVRAGEQGGRAPPVGSRVQLNFESTSESRSRPH